MKVNIQAVKTNIPEALKPYIQEKMDKLDKFYPNIIHGDIFLKKEQGAHEKDKIVEAEIFLPGPTIFASTKADTYQAAVNELFDQLKKQLIKKRELESNHRP